MRTPSSSREVLHAQARRLLAAASAVTTKSLVGKIVHAGPRTLLLLGIADESMAEATRLHHALIDVSIRERLDVDVIVVAERDRR